MLLVVTGPGRALRPVGRSRRRAFDIPGRAGIAAAWRPAELLADDRDRAPRDAGPEGTDVTALR
ncbi:hypothetical protein GCM10010129_70910 [Streptomyces fumigatiscleroticus]|nr:hypothetical protein GCM10010129_70910 [Streptomyces fumigatiscleroticus]